MTGLWNKVQVQSITFHFGLQSGYLFWDIRHDIKQLCGSHESHWQWLKIQSDPSRTNYVLSTESSTTRELQDRKKEKKARRDNKKSSQLISNNTVLTEEGCLLSQKYQIEECNLVGPDHLESTILKITRNIYLVI